MPLPFRHLDKFGAREERLITADFFIAGFVAVAFFASDCFCKRVLAGLLAARLLGVADTPLANGFCDLILFLDIVSPFGEQAATPQAEDEQTSLLTR